MSEHGEPTRPGLSDWQAESLRLTAFLAQPASPQQLAALPGWESVFGSPAANSASREHGQQINENGAFGGNWLTLIRQATRVDWVFHKRPDTGTVLGEAMKGLGPVVDVLPTFDELVGRWLATAPALNRLAFGVVANLPVADAAAGAATISRFLPFRLPPASARDFAYQINRPRVSSVSGVQGMPINRLCKWALAIVNVAEVTIVVGSPIPSLVQDKQEMCRIELDINSPAERVESLPQSAQVELFREFVAMACEIMKEGDVA